MSLERDFFELINRIISYSDINRTRRKDSEYFTYSEIAQVMGVDQNTVRNIERKALAKLRHPNNRKKMEELKESIWGVVNASNYEECKVSLASK